MTRKSFNAKERGRLFTLYKGVCYLCEGKIHTGDAWEIEHQIPWELSRDDSDDNLRLAHVKCHKAKSAVDIGIIRKCQRIEQKHLGMRPRSRTPLPFGKSSGLKRKLSGEIVER